MPASKKPKVSPQEAQRIYEIQNHSEAPYVLGVDTEEGPRRGQPVVIAPAAKNGRPPGKVQVTGAMLAQLKTLGSFQENSTGRGFLEIRPLG